MMSQTGMGVMIHALSGGSKHSASEYAGKVIAAAKIENERLKITFSDGKEIHIWDDGQSCCESRYMKSDDDLSCLIGGVLQNIEAKDAPELPDEYGVHECVFVEVTTDKGHIQVTNHNEHNGYYGGFGLTITEAGE